MSTLDRWQWETIILSMNVDKKLLETQSGDKWQSKTLFLAIFDMHWSIGKSFSDCRLSGVMSAMGWSVICDCGISSSYD